MGHVHVEHHIEAPVEHVWELMLQTDRMAEWNPYQEMSKISGSLGTVGTTFEGTIKVIGHTFEGTGSVVEAEAPRHLRLRTTTRSGEVTDYVFDYVPEGAGMRCVLDVEYELPAGILGGILDRVFIERSIDRQMHQVADNFAALAEATVPQPV